MPIKLPQLIADFVQAKNNYDTEALAIYFANNAVVHDEGQEIHGVHAIKEWNKKNNKKYQDTLEVTHIVEHGNEVILTAQVSGNFEGSPVPLNFHFTIKDDKITVLNIQLTGD